MAVALALSSPVLLRRPGARAGSLILALLLLSSAGGAAPTTPPRGNEASAQDDATYPPPATSYLRGGDEAPGHQDWVPMSESNDGVS